MRRRARNMISQKPKNIVCEKSKEQDDESYSILLVFVMLTLMSFTVLILAIAYTRHLFHRRSSKVVSDIREFRRFFDESQDIRLHLGATHLKSYSEHIASSHDMFTADVSELPFAKSEAWSFQLAANHKPSMTVRTESGHMVDISDMRHSDVHKDGCFTIDVKEKQTKKWYTAVFKDKCNVIRNQLQYWSLSSREFIVGNNYIVGDEDFPEGYGNNVLIFHASDPVHFKLRQKHEGLGFRSWKERFIRSIDFNEDEGASHCFEFMIELYAESEADPIYVTVNDGCYFLRQAIESAKSKDRSYPVHLLVNTEETVHAHMRPEMLQSASMIWKSPSRGNIGKMYLQLGRRLLHMRQIHYSKDVQLNSQRMCIKFVVETGKERFVLFAEENCEIISLDLQHSDAYVSFIAQASRNN